MPSSRSSRRRRSRTRPRPIRPASSPGRTGCRRAPSVPPPPPGPTERRSAAPPRRDRSRPPAADDPVRLETPPWFDPPDARAWSGMLYMLAVVTEWITGGASSVTVPATWAANADVRVVGRTGGRLRRRGGPMRRDVDFLIQFIQFAGVVVAAAAVLVAVV